MLRDEVFHKLLLFYQSAYSPMFSVTFSPVVILNVALNTKGDLASTMYLNWLTVLLNTAKFLTWELVYRMAMDCVLLSLSSLTATVAVCFTLTDGIWLTTAI